MTPKWACLRRWRGTPPRARRFDANPRLTITTIIGSGETPARPLFWRIVQPLRLIVMLPWSYQPRSMQSTGCRLCLSAGPPGPDYQPPVVEWRRHRGRARRQVRGDFHSGHPLGLAAVSEPTRPGRHMRAVLVLGRSTRKRNQGIVPHLLKQRHYALSALSIRKYLYYKHLQQRTPSAAISRSAIQSNRPRG